MLGAGVHRLVLENGKLVGIVTSRSRPRLQLQRRRACTRDPYRGARAPCSTARRSAVEAAAGEALPWPERPTTAPTPRHYPPSSHSSPALSTCTQPTPQLARPRPGALTVGPQRNLQFPIEVHWPAARQIQRRRLNWPATRRPPPPRVELDTDPAHLQRAERLSRRVSKGCPA